MTVAKAITAVIILMLCASTILLGQQLPMDSLFDACNHSTIYSQRINTAYQINVQIENYHRDKRYYTDSLIAIINQLIPIANSTKDTQGLAYLYGIKGKNYNLLHRLDSAIYYLELASNICKVSGNWKSYANYCQILRLPYLKRNQVNISIGYLFRALNIYEQLKDTFHVAECYFDMAHTYYYQDRAPDKIIEYLSKLNIANTDMVGACYISEAYLKLNMPDSSYRYLKKGESVLEGRVSYQVPYYYRALAAYFQYIGELDSATFYFHKAIDGLEKVQQQHNSVSCFFHLGEIAFWKNNFIKSERYYTSAEDYAYKYDRYFELSKIYFGKSKLYERQHQLDKAYQAMKQYKMVEDSLKRTETTDAVLAAELNYQFSLEEAKMKEEQLIKEYEKQALVQQQKVTNQIASGIIFFISAFALTFFLQRMRISKAKKSTDDLLLNILPAEVAEELKSKGTADAKHFDNVTVLFTDFISFTTVSEQLSPQELVDELHACFKGFDEICTKHNIEKIKTIGDAYLAVCGLPQADENHAENVVWAALEIREFMKQRRAELGAKTFEIRIGINSGSVVAGIVGVKKFAYDIWGDTVNTAARMEQNSEAGKINISETTYALVKDKFTCEYRGEIDAKNKGKLKMYFVEKFRHDS